MSYWLDIMIFRDECANEHKISIRLIIGYCNVSINNFGIYGNLSRILWVDLLTVGYVCNVIWHWNIAKYEICSFWMITDFIPSKLFDAFSIVDMMTSVQFKITGLMSFYLNMSCYICIVVTHVMLLWFHRISFVLSNFHYKNAYPL